MNLNLTISAAATRSGVISYDTLRDRCIDLVAEKGESYRGHPGAYFKPDGSPGCLLGELAAQDGATKRKLGGSNQAGVSSLVALGYLIPADSLTGYALGELQNYNDSGYTWFDAVCLAFGMTPEDLSQEIEDRKRVPVTFDAEGYVNWVESFADPIATVHVLTNHTPAKAFEPMPEHVLVA